jgi:hypothetical protein
MDTIKITKVLVFPGRDQAFQPGLPLTDRLFDCRYNHLGAVADGLKRHLDIRLVFLVR